MSAVPAGWTWLVADGVDPAPDALAELVAAAQRHPGGVLYASAVTGEEPWPRILDKADAIGAAADALVALRATIPASLLVRSDLVPAGPLTFAWTARLLRDRPGYLAPRSRATRSDAPRRTGLRPLVLRGWRREERLWLLMRAVGERSG